MRYNCVSKECKYKFKGKSKEVPLVCPKCGSDLKKIFGAKAKGDNFERAQAEFVCLMYGMTGNFRCQRNLMSGAADGRRGDLKFLPSTLDTFVHEVKNWKTPSVGSFWAQALKEAEEMAKEPAVWFKLKGSYTFKSRVTKQKEQLEVDDIVIMFRRKTIIKLLVELENLRSKAR